MSDRDALLAAVLAAPADDVPRLVYADFLDESGDPGDAGWAALIRVQCRVAGLVRAGHRSRAEVEAARHNAVGGGCCDRFADMKACDCLAAAAALGNLRDVEAAALAAHARDILHGNPLPAVRVVVPRVPSIRQFDDVVTGSAWAAWDAVVSEQFDVVVTGAAWDAGGEGVIRATFARGFVSLVACSLAAWERHGGAVLARWPVRKVEFTPD